MPFYGFSDDVLPDQFLELLPSYFSVRQTHDTHLIQELYRKGEGFFDYESVSAHSRNFVREITTDKQNGQLALYQRENNLNDAMMNCLDTCYTLSRAYAIPFNKITGWMSASIRHENLWQTYPVTCSNLQSYITKQLARDTRLTVLADQIKTVSTQLSKAESRVYLPASSDVEMDVTSGGVQKMCSVRMVQTNEDTTERLFRRMAAARRNGISKHLVRQRTNQISEIC